MMATKQLFPAPKINAIKAEPHRWLGLQCDNASGYLVITCWLPDADSVSIVDSKTGKTIAQLDCHASGVFNKKLRRKKPFRYQLRVTNEQHEQLIEDPYQYSPWLTNEDLQRLRTGTHPAPYHVMGAKVVEHQGVTGTAFTVWAPNARSVSVIGEFNQWHSERHLATNLDNSGFWHLFIPENLTGQSYKFSLLDSNGNRLADKADPYGEQAEYRPATASIVANSVSYNWQDDKWLQQRAERNRRDAPISIYEVHLGSWRRDNDNNFLNYREIAEQLIPYVLEMGFTHIQLMPVSEFPFDGSWGYQPVGLFAPSARFGDADDFRYFIEQCHQANLGVLIDWVPGHFPSDAHGLATFDGSHLYEHADPRQGYHPDWNTLIYNYGRTEVANFLCASALHWLDNYHVDGIRVDAVASMLYLDYSRKDGEWVPNKHGGRENLEAIEFLQRFNCELYQNFPDCFSVAEESTAWPGVTKTTDAGGLGFGYKWNMGWMNDSLRYMQREPIHRQHHHNELSFGLVYGFDENFILPLSHDEVVHGKGSLLARMPGDCWQQFANLRAYFGFMWAHPGKKLLFMGGEFAQGKEWNHDQQLDWHQLAIHWHQGVQKLVKDLNRVYREVPALHQLDCQLQGFQWLDHENAEQSIYSFVRYGESDQHPVVVVCNFTPQSHNNFKIGVPAAGHYQELINTDAECYSGSGNGNFGGCNSQPGEQHGQQQYIEINVPPLSTLIFQLSEES